MLMLYANIVKALCHGKHRNSTFLGYSDTLSAQKPIFSLPKFLDRNYFLVLVQELVHTISLTTIF